jgi:hypothetical protein
MLTIKTIVIRDIIGTIAAIIMITWTLIAVADWAMGWTPTNVCPAYALPEFLSSPTDGETVAIGMLLVKAANNDAQCVTVTNLWFGNGNRIVTAVEAIELAKGY